MASRRLQGFWGILGILILILDSRTAVQGARDGIALCLQTVIPSLFPFLILSRLITGSMLGRELPLLRGPARLLGLPKGGESMLVGIYLGGYPIGAGMASEGFQKGKLSREEALRLLRFCNQPGPAFLFGMVGCFFDSKIDIWVLWLIQIISSILVSFCYPCRYFTATQTDTRPASAASALQESVGTMGIICGWIVLFRIMLTYLDRWLLHLLPAPWRVGIAGLLELSNGCCSLGMIADNSIRFLLCTMMLSLGGLCVTMQTQSVIGSLPIGSYLQGKLLQTFFAFFLSLAYIHRMPFYLLIFLPALYLRFRFPRKTSSNPLRFGV